jgi:hypothetical protein
LNACGCSSGAHELLLDNTPPEEMRQVVELAKGKAVLEASGGITLANARRVAETGVDYISVGALFPACILLRRLGRPRESLGLRLALSELSWIRPRARQVPASEGYPGL